MLWKKSSSAELNRSAMVARQVFAAVAESLAATQCHVQTCAVGSQTHSRPRWCRILDPGNDDSVEYVVLRSGRSAMLAQNSHRVHDAGARRQQHGHVVSSRQPVVYDDTEDSQTGHTLNVRTRRRRRSLSACCEDDLLRLVSI